MHDKFKVTQLRDKNRAGEVPLGVSIQQKALFLYKTELANEGQIYLIFA